MIRVLLVLLLAGVSHAGSYDLGIAAKRAGEHEEAIRHLARALEENPKQVEAWFHYGTVLGWEKRYKEAEQAIERGLDLAPRDYDLRMARARLMAWQGDYAGSLRVLGKLADEYPDSNEIKVMQGRVAGWSSRPDEARSHYDAVLANDPKQVDALSGLAELARDRGEMDLAIQLYRRAYAVDPSPLFQNRIEQLEDVNEWRLDAGFTYSTFRHSDRKDWVGGWTQVTRITPTTAEWLKVEQEERFGDAATTIQAGWTRRIDGGHAIGLYGGGTPDAEWAQRWLLGGNVVWSPLDEGLPVFVVDVRHSDYVPGGVWMIRSGVDQPLGGASNLALRWNRVEVDGSSAVDGYLVALEKNFNDEWWARVGFASGAETITGDSLAAEDTRRSRNVFLGLRGPLNENASWRVDVAREMVERSDDRDSISIGVQYRF